MSKLETNRRSYFSLSYTLIIPLEHRDVSDAIEKLLVKIFIEQCGRSDMCYEDHRVDDGYVTYMFSAKKIPTELDKFVNAYKTTSSRQARKALSLPEDEGFWDKSYCLVSRGDGAKEREEEFVTLYNAKRGK